MNNAAHNKTEFTPLHPSLSHTGYAIHIHSDALGNHTWTSTLKLDKQSTLH